MAASIVNLSAKLTANTSEFASRMKASQKVMDQFRATAGTLRRAIRLTFGVIALKGFVGMIRRAWQNAERLGVQLRQIDRIRLQQVAVAFNNFRAALAKLILNVGAKLAPVLVSVLERMTRWADALERRLTPGTLRFIGVLAATTVGIYAAIKAIQLINLALDVWRKKTLLLAGAKALLLALSGPAGWAMLAVGIGVAAAATGGLLATFGAFEKKATGGIRGVSGELSKLDAQMRNFGRAEVVDAAFSSAGLTGPITRGVQARMSAVQQSGFGGVANQTVLFNIFWVLEQQLQLMQEDRVQSRQLTPQPGYYEPVPRMWGGWGG